MRRHGPAPTKPVFWGCRAALGCPRRNGAQILHAHCKSLGVGESRTPRGALLGRGGLCQACGMPKGCEGLLRLPLHPVVCGAGRCAWAAAPASKL